MPTVFELIIAGKIPGKFIWADDVCVAFLTIGPVAAGHALVVPRSAEPKWTNLPRPQLDHLMGVAQAIGQAQEQAFDVPRAALVIAGFEVPHTHIHVIPARTEADCNLSNASAATGEELADPAQKLRAQLVADGHGANVPAAADSPLLA